MEHKQNAIEETSIEMGMGKKFVGRCNCGYHILIQPVLAPDERSSLNLIKLGLESHAARMKREQMKREVA